MSTTATPELNQHSPADEPDPVELRCMRDLSLTATALEHRKDTLEKLAKKAEDEGYPRQAREIRADALAIREDILPAFREQHELPLVTDGQLEGGIAEALRGLVHSTLVKHRNDVDGEHDLERENEMLESLGRRISRFAMDVATRSWGAGYAARNGDEPEALVQRSIQTLRPVS